MNKLLLSIFCIITILNINCHQPIPKKMKKTIPESRVDKVCQAINQTKEVANGLYASHFKKVELDGNCLMIHVSAAYNNKTASDFELRWNGKTKRSMPPQVTLALHAEKGDEGYEAHDFILKYDLAEIQAINPNGSVFVTLRGYEERIELGKVE
jgi:hypothetical protein